MTNPWQLLWIYLLAANVFAFFVYGIDKYKAKYNKYRISERCLILTALFGGSIGALAGMRVFRHKTLHRKFTIGVPFILILQLALAAFLLIRSNEALMTFLF